MALRRFFGGSARRSPGRRAPAGSARPRRRRSGGSSASSRRCRPTGPGTWPASPTSSAGPPTRTWSSPTTRPRSWRGSSSSTAGSPRPRPSWSSRSPSSRSGCSAGPRTTSSPASGSRRRRLEERLALLRCCFLIDAVDDTITAEESAVLNEIANELLLDAATIARVRGEFTDRYAVVQAMRADGLGNASGTGAAPRLTREPAGQARRSSTALGPSRRPTSASSSAS